MPKNAVKPMTSVIVVSTTQPAKAGSIFSLRNITGTNTPANAATAKLIVSAAAIMPPIFISPNQAVPCNKANSKIFNTRTDCLFILAPPDKGQYLPDARSKRLHECLSKVGLENRTNVPLVAHLLYIPNLQQTSKHFYYQKLPKWTFLVKMAGHGKDRNQSSKWSIQCVICLSEDNKK